jgi:DNA-binding MarR family transcriptional regulator
MTLNPCDESHSFAIRVAAKCVSQLYERHLKPSGLTPSQFAIVAQLHRSAPITMLELSEVMAMDRTTLVRAIKPLRRQGLLIAIPASYDPRTLLLLLSDNGRLKHAEARKYWADAQVEFEASFGRERAERLRLELLSLARIRQATA